MTHSLTHSLSYNGSSLAVRLYSGIDGLQTAFSIYVQDKQKGSCYVNIQLAIVKETVEGILPVAVLAS